MSGGGGGGGTARRYSSEPKRFVGLSFFLILSNF